MAHRTVWCATGQCPVHQGRTLRTSHSQEFQSVVRYNSPDCPVSQQSNDYPAPTVDCKSTCHSEQCATESEQRSQRGIGLSIVALDCPVTQEDKASNGRLAPNSNGWVTWQRTGQGTVPFRWRTGLSGAPIASSLPNGYGSGWGL
jgi:hypothetical protein